MQQSIKLWASQILNRSIPDLSIIKDPTVMRQLLLLMQPQFFRSSPHKTPQQILQSVSDYFRSELRLDVSKKTKSPTPLSLWQLFLGIAIKCPQRNTYIKMILNFDEVTMANLMSFINMISEDCVEVTESRIQDPTSKLEKALLNTIEELTEENNNLKEKLDAIEQKWEEDRVELQEKVRELKQEVAELKGERLEVLGEYEGEWKTGSLLDIFKSIELEGTQLRSALETKDQIIKSYENATEQLARDCQKLKDENKEMRRHHNRIQDLERQFEEAQITIRDLKQTEKKHLQDIYQLQEKYLNLRKKLDKGQGGEDDAPRFSTTADRPSLSDQLTTSVIIGALQSSSSPLPQIPQQQQPALSPSPSLVSRKTTIKRELIPFVKQQQNAVKVKQLQKQLNSLSSKIEDKELQIDELKKVTQERNEKIQDLESKIAHVERLNKLYSENLREKEKHEEGKEQEYRVKFRGLVEEIEELRKEEKGKIQTMGIMTQEAIAERKLLEQQYDQKVEKIIGMLEHQLMEFRDKELDYLEKIRRLNQQIDKLTSNAHPQTIVLEPEETNDTFVPKEQIKQIFCEPLPVTQLSTQQLQQLQTVKQKIIELQSINIQNDQFILKLETKLRQSIEREGKHLQNLNSLTEKIQTLQNQLEDYRNTFLKYLEKVLEQTKQRLQSHQITNKQTIENTEVTVSKQYEQSLQKIISEISQIKDQQQSHLQSIIELSQKQQKPVEIIKQVKSETTQHQIKILDFFKTQLEQTKQKSPMKMEDVQNISAVQSKSVDQTMISEGTSLNEQTQNNINKIIQSHQQQFDIFTQKLKEKEERIKLITAQASSKSKQLSEIQKTVSIIESTNKLLRQQNLSLISNIQNLKQKTFQLQHNHQNDEFYKKASDLIDEISRSRQKQNSTNQLVQKLREQIKQKTIQNNELLEKIKTTQNSFIGNSAYINAIKQTNAKLIEQLAAQSKNLELFRMRYTNMYQMCRATQEQNQVLVAVLADLRVNFKTC